MKCTRHSRQEGASRFHTLSGCTTPPAPPAPSEAALGKQTESAPSLALLSEVVIGDESSKPLITRRASLETSPHPSGLSRSHSVDINSGTAERGLLELTKSHFITSLREFQDF